MHSSFEISAERRVCTIRIHGLATPQGLAQAFFDAFSSKDWDRSYNLMIVYEVDALLGELTLDGLRELQDKLNARQAEIGLKRRMKSALVYCRPEQRSLLELHVLSYDEQSFLEERVFATEADALQWLNSADPAASV
ncbi:hypothetical protein [Maricaulis sp.]|uniref:hypothetical protein n=1 Tax=Maricaulis sp. TaxID=1486257 RepID=UPI00261E5082|nr:hypothetical protein [Maricaulis sp.]